MLSTLHCLCCTQSRAAQSSTTHSNILQLTTSSTAPDWAGPKVTLRIRRVCAFQLSLLHMSHRFTFHLTNALLPSLFLCVFLQVLYHEIVSHARVVSACIRAASEREREQSQSQSQLQSQQPASLNSNCSSESTSESVTKSNSLSSGFASDAPPLNTSGKGNAAGAAGGAGGSSAAGGATGPQSRKSEGNLERLRDRYHLLYLKAFELQLCLDNLLRKRSSTAVSLKNEDVFIILFYIF